MFDVNEVRKRFPIIINNPDKIFFDNAATSQKPDIVINSINEYYFNYCANYARGSYSLANKVSNEIEKIRNKVAEFVNANSNDEIIFTSGATDSLNTIIFSWALYNLKDGDEIMLCLTDHKSTVLPWFNLHNIHKRFGIKIKLVFIQPDQYSGDYVFDDISDKMSSQTKIIVLTHVHNVFGVDMGVKTIRNRVGNDVLIALDASQSVGHKNIDVKDLNVDFLCFSGHKMFTETGVGVLWINKRVHRQLHPFKVGGGYLETFSTSNNELKITKMPGLLECGTLNISGIISLGKAIDFINEVGIHNIESYLIELTTYLLQQLKASKLEIEFLPGPIYCNKCAVGNGIVSFKIKGHKSSDIGFLLNANNIMVRTGNHCMANETIYDDNIRISFHIYNTISEIDTFIEILTQNILQ